MTKEEKIVELVNIRDNSNYTLTPREVFDDAIKALEQESCDKYIKEIKHLRKYINKLETQIVEQEPRKGHWIKSDIPNEKYICSECGGACWYYDYQGDVSKSKYCPNCGAKMTSENKE